MIALWRQIRKCGGEEERRGPVEGQNGVVAPSGGTVVVTAE